MIDSGEEEDSLNHQSNYVINIQLVDDLMENVLPTYENAKLYKTISDTTLDLPPPYEVATLHM